MNIPKYLLLDYCFLKGMEEEKEKKEGEKIHSDKVCFLWDTLDIVYFSEEGTMVFLLVNYPNLITKN